jgi:hypothetical protein
MKIFSIRNMLGLAAIGGAAYYVRKQGGFKQTWTKLSGIVSDKLGSKDSAPSPGATKPAGESVGYGAGTYGTSKPRDLPH